MNKTAPDTSTNALSTWQLDEHPGDTELNKNWQQIASKFDYIDGILASISGYATKTELNQEISERDASDTEVLSQAKTYTDSKLNGKANVVTNVNGKQVVQVSQSLLDGATEIPAANIATKAYVGQQNQATGFTVDVLTTVGFSQGGEYYTRQVWLRYVNGALKSWAPALNYAAVKDSTNWLTTTLDFTLTDLV